MVVKYHEYWDLLEVEQHEEFQNKLKKLIFMPKERNEFYKKLLEIKNDMSEDTFKEYFELYAAERKTNQQDFTPGSISSLITKIGKIDRSGRNHYSAYDGAAGTGALIIAAWHSDRLEVAPWNYFPHNYFYMAEELSNNALIYLIHNLAIRGMNAIVMHGDSIERKYKQVYFIQNSQDDHMKFSDVNVMPHSEKAEQIFDVREWIEDEIDYKESSKVVWQGFRDHEIKTENKQTTLF